MSALVIANYSQNFNYRIVEMNYTLYRDILLYGRSHGDPKLA